MEGMIKVDPTCIFLFVIVIISFILLRKITSIYIFDSNSNSIKNENSLIWQTYIFLVSGLILVICIFLEGSMKFLLKEIIFIVYCIYNLINIIWFISVLWDGKQKYIRSSSSKILIYFHLFKNFVLIYLLYNYYELIIK